MTPEEQKVMELALEALENNRQTHHYCEDTWYSCPKHEDGCANEAEGAECNCGADEINAQFDKTITAIKEVLAQPEQEIIPLNIEDGYVRDYLWDRALVAIDDPCARSHPHENMGAYCKHRTELARIQAQKLDKNDEISIAYGLPKEPEQEPNVDHQEFLRKYAAAAEYFPPRPKEPEQEPVAITRFGLNPDNGMMYESKRGPWCLFKDIPPQRKPLTDEEISEIVTASTGWNFPQSSHYSLARAIEAAHGIKE